MVAPQQPDLHRAWCWFEQQVLYAQNYNLLPNLSGPTAGGGPANPVLDRILPGLLTIKAVALLDEDLEIKTTLIGAASGSSSLYDRIEAVASADLIDNREKLHRIREQRNKLAHESDSHTSWNGMSQIVATIRNCLQDLGMVGDIPPYEVKGERSAWRESDDPKAVSESTFRVFVTSGDRVVSEIKSIQKLMGDES